MHSPPVMSAAGPQRGLSNKGAQPWFNSAAYTYDPIFRNRAVSTWSTLSTTDNVVLS
ncbi:hypothetical protein BCV69DRAFT_282744 [Microstroma glucosiphilum]|uniref:Uncharacterized protein n=1 Tax=Pseudomicrostroma glucosiphilum TaxID=1684307 RepID=A0A316U7V6_9BASI|nr:hypothetical protein BCV69DRAFT_282744 [Pseudomicrostroma glucosiphilum]PWN20531.1 hypothetical protein BCV69DRAFT_282744 [Pseudomicrostroma glucosiphilum]